MILWLYSTLMVLMQPLVRYKLLKRSVQEPGYGVDVSARFGHYTCAALPADGRTVWVHAVSLGETRAAATLLAALRKLQPRMRLLLTHGTATGYAEGRKLLQAGDVQTWQPWDTPAAVAAFLNHFNPAIGVLIETEIWPNLLAVCQQQKVPVALANARLNNKSLRWAQVLGGLSRPAFAALNAVWAQTEADAHRLRQLGARVQGVFGNIKFDASPDAGQINVGKTWRGCVAKPVVMLASSRDEEELALLQVLRALGQVASNIQWLIVPRHPQRFDAVAALIESQGFAVWRRSADETNRANGLERTAATLWLGDTLGEMAVYYSLADVALLGGSFEPLGGQNLIEAAACACPVVMGPHTFNFADAAILALQAGAARRVSDMAQAVQLAMQLAASPAQRSSMALAAERFAKSNQGAADRTARAVLGMLPLSSRQITDAKRPDALG